MAHQELDDHTADLLADFFRSLSDPTRLRILAELAEGEVNVGELVKRIGLSKSAISHQLRGLRDRRVIRWRRQGRLVFVALDDAHISDIYQRGLDHILHE